MQFFKLFLKKDTREGKIEEFVRALAGYWNARGREDSACILLGGMAGTMPAVELTVAVGKLLAWLRLEHKRAGWHERHHMITNRPLAIDMRVPWCRSVARLVDEHPLFGRYLCIKDNELTVSPEISEEERLGALKLVGELYQPTLMS